LLADRELRMALGRAGQERARGHFTLARAAREIAAIYSELIASSPPPAPTPGGP